MSRTHEITPEFQAKVEIALLRSQIASEQEEKCRLILERDSQIEALDSQLNEKNELLTKLESEHHSAVSELLGKLALKDDAIKLMSRSHTDELNTLNSHHEKRLLDINRITAECQVQYKIMLSDLRESCNQLTRTIDKDRSNMENFRLHYEHDLSIFERIVGKLREQIRSLTETFSIERDSLRNELNAIRTELDRTISQKDRIHGELIESRRAVFRIKRENEEDRIRMSEESQKAETRLGFKVDSLSRRLEVAELERDQITEERFRIEQEVVHLRSKLVDNEKDPVITEGLQHEIRSLSRQLKASNAALNDQRIELLAIKRDHEAMMSEQRRGYQLLVNENTTLRDEIRSMGQNAEKTLLNHEFEIDKLNKVHNSTKQELYVWKRLMENQLVQVQTLAEKLKHYRQEHKTLRACVSESECALATVLARSATEKEMLVLSFEREREDLEMSKQLVESRLDKTLSELKQIETILSAVRGELDEKSQQVNILSNESVLIKQRELDRIAEIDSLRSLFGSLLQSVKLIQVHVTYTKELVENVQDTVNCREQELGELRDTCHDLRRRLTDTEQILRTQMEEMRNSYELTNVDEEVPKEHVVVEYEKKLNETEAQLVRKKIILGDFQPTRRSSKSETRSLFRLESLKIGEVQSTNK